jgi:hypothetical protein
MIAFTAPVRLRLVASGLMIEKVRSTAIGQFLPVFWEKQGVRARLRKRSSWRLIATTRRSGNTEQTFRDPRNIVS